MEWINLAKRLFIDDQLSYSVALMSNSKSLTVTRLVRRMRNLLEIELGEVWVEGEVSNLRRQASGHVYFTLKDEGAQISCVLFRGNANKCKVQPDNGMQVQLFGEVSVYEARGTVQLIVRTVESAGEGELQAKFERLKKKLAGEGLFDQERKQAIPKFPKKVGLITSGTGAALQDMLNVLGRRAPWVQPVLYPVQVQGAGAERGIAQAIDRWSDWELNGLPEVDVIIVGRGGGSLEDLWNFNEEIVARAIDSCNIPIVSAVGHEIDFTIADFVADMRAPTPSAAAELVVPDGEAIANRLLRLKSTMLRVTEGRVQQHQLLLESMKRGALSQSTERVLREPLLRLEQSTQDLDNAVVSSIEAHRNALKNLGLKLATHAPERVLERRGEYLDLMHQRLSNALREQLAKLESTLNQKRSMLRTLGPESAFARGFSVTLTAEGKLVTSADDLKKGDQLITKFAQGEVVSEVSE